jgi:putative hemolysin
VMTLLRLKPAPDSVVTEEEVKALIAEGASAGVFHPAERELIEGVLKIGDRTVRTIMVPRTAVVWLDVEDKPEEIYATIAATGHSRYPVARGDIEDVIGVAQTKDLLEQQRKHGTIDVAAAAREPPYVVDRMPVLRLLERFKASAVHLAIVVDEHGSFEGIVTPTDILTAIAGDLPENEEAVEPLAVQRDDGSWLLDGLIPIPELKDRLQLRSVPEEEKARYQALSGMLMLVLGRMPQTGDTIVWESWKLEVIDMDGKRIDKVLATPVSTAPAPAAEMLEPEPE